MHRRWHNPALPVLAVAVSLPLVLGLVPRDSAAPAEAYAVSDTDFPACTDPQAGVQLHAIWEDYDDATRARVLDEMVEIGMRSVRIDISWAAMEPQQGRIDAWKEEQLARVLAQVADRGLDPLVMVWQSPDWSRAGGDIRSAPGDPAAYGDFLAWVSDRYPSVRSWQIWNEPNDGDFLRGADPVTYAGLLRAGYAGVQRGNPEARVVFGGPAYQDVDWIRAVYDNGGAGRFDVMATHGYQQPETLGPYAASEGSQYRMRSVALVRDLMVRRGDAAKPIWFTELGWSAYGGGVSEQRQAIYYAETMQMLRDEFPYVQRAYWYNARDRASGSDRLDGYGLLRRDLSRKPVAWAAQQTARTCG